MKNYLIAGAVATASLLTACNSNNSKTEHQHEHEGHTSEAAMHATSTSDDDVKTIQATFTNVDATVATAMKEIVNHYLHIKNALINDNAVEAASGGKAMATVIRKLDKSLLTVEQKKTFDENQDGLTENAEHIAGNGGNIKHQREHFNAMSKEVYALAKSFGGGRLLYHDHCPMYNDNKGGMWLSEAKEVKNPYFGASMLTCGSIQEIIQ